MSNRKKIIRILSWIALLIITIILFMIAYALFTQNGRLAFAMIFLLAFVSILLYFVLKINKNIEMKEEDLLEKDNIHKNSKLNTKNI